MMMTALWDIAPRALVDVCRRFRDAYCVRHQDDETSVYFNETTWRYIPESCHHITCRENLKYHVSRTGRKQDKTG
jgi:hypothetical protein